MSCEYQRRRVILLVAAAAVIAWVGPVRPASAAPIGLDDDARWASGRVLRKEITVDADLGRVWHAWTTPKGMTSFFAADADIEMRIGGKYEIYINPDPAVTQRGCEGCTVRSYIPLEMLAFDWTSPPSIPNPRSAGIMTQVVVRFEKADGGGVRVTLTQLGFGTGEDWDRNYEYFNEAWPKVLANLKTTLEANSAGTAKPRVDPPKSVRSVDGRVTVTSHVSPIKYQDFEIVLPAPVETVWGLIATNDGLRDMVHKEAAIELTPGGLYQDWPGNVKKILAFVPGEMLSGVGGAPPMFPSVQQGGTWFVYRLVSIDATSTRLRMAVLGWHEQSGEEWTRAFDYFLKNNPVYLNKMLYPKAAAAKTGVRAELTKQPN